MANIGQDTNAMPTGGKEVNRLLNAVQDDLTEVRAELNRLITDVTLTRAEVVKLVTDLTANRAEIVKLVTDIATHRTEANKIRTGLINMTLTDAASTIATAKAKIKTVTNPISYIIGGTFYSKAATDDFWVLTGFNCTNALYNKCLLCIDSSGNMQIAAGTEGASAGAVVLPAIPASYAVVGMVQVHPTGTGNFTGGTTELDDGTVVPNAVYTDLAFHPDTFAALAAGTAGNPAALTAVAPASLTATAAAALTLTE
jgi:hypothetical protein